MTELADAGIPVTVTCRVLKLARQPYFRWLAAPITTSEVVEAYRANALFDAHRADPEFGHRLLADEAREAVEVVSDRTGPRGGSPPRTAGSARSGNPSAASVAGPGRRCTTISVPSSMSMAGPGMLFAAEAPTQLWLTDITEHKTAEGKLYLCAIKDIYSGRIVGYSIDTRMKFRLAVQALENAVAIRGDVAGCIVHSDRGFQFRSRKMRRALTRHRMVGSL